MKYKILSIATFVLLFIACATKTKMVSAEKPVPITKNFVTVVSESDIVQRGSLLYQNNCGSCHELHKISDYTLEAWKPILDRMQIEAKISDQDKEDIYFYISRSR